MTEIKHWGWIGVDFDGTLAIDTGSQCDQPLGDPIPLMVDRVKAMLADGWDVRIFTARAAITADHTYAAYYDGTSQTFHREQNAMIRQWCVQHLGRVLPITATKDFQMVQLWDDRCIQVVHNIGLAVAGEPV